MFRSLRVDALATRWRVLAACLDDCLSGIEILPRAYCYALCMLNDAFDANCAALQQIKDAGGDVNVSKYDPDPARKVLGMWLSRRRQAKRKGTLSAERVSRLDALGVWWSKPRTS